MPPSTGSPQTNGSSPPPIYSTRFKIIAAVLVTAAIAAFVAAYLSTADSDDTSSGGSNGFVERLIPAQNTQLVQQGTVGIDLAAGWEGQLVIDGTSIPAEQLDFYVKPKAVGGTTIPSVNSGNVLQFTPGEGKVLDALPVGNVCANASVWKTAEGPDSARLVTWCFDVI
jgi:hypothetical protein